MSDAEIIRAAILAGQDPTEVGKAPAAGGEVTEDAGHSVVVIEDRGRQVTPESGHETTGLSYGFSAMEELLQTQLELPTISIATEDNIGDVAIEGEGFFKIKKDLVVKINSFKICLVSFVNNIRIHQLSLGGLK